VNGFIVPMADYEHMSVHEQDEYDLNKIYEILEQTIIPMYYDNHDKWLEIVKNGMSDVRYKFESNRMADEYYQIMYNG
jgi:starch phosphorylase